MNLRIASIATTLVAAVFYAPPVLAYGALAIDTLQGQLYGSSSNETSEEGARTIATLSCGTNCHSVVLFSHTCAAYAADQTPGSNIAGWANSVGQETASMQALNSCRQHGGARCLVRVWACEQIRNASGTARAEAAAAPTAAPSTPVPAVVANGPDPEAARRAIENAFSRFANAAPNAAPPAATPAPQPAPPVAVAPPPPPPVVANAPAATPPRTAIPPSLTDAVRRVALVIGNDKYQNLEQLQKAVNDSRAIGDALSKIGFDVMHVENAVRRTMNQKLVEFAGKVGRGDTAFFFYSGHGVEIHGQNFLLPIDMPQVHENEEALVTGEGIPFDSLIEQLQARGAKLVMVVLDACRENPFAKQGTRGIGGARGGLAESAPPEGVFVLYSAGVGQTALDRLSDNDNNPNSVFTRKFIQVLGTPGLTVQQVATQTRAAVHELAATVNHPQMPAYYDQVLGQFTLTPVR